MAEEWRVSLVIDGAGGTIKRSQFRGLLRSRLGEDVAISVGQTDIFLYTGSAKAADEAGQVARAALEEQGRPITEIRLERWDLAGGKWRDPGEPTEYEDELRPSRLRTTAVAIVKAAGEAWQWADFP